jgi:hypothetical protein
MRRILALALAACAAAAFAQAPPAPATDPTPRYEVEIIVFAHRDFDPAEERFDEAPQRFDQDDATTLRDAPVFDETTFDPPALPAPLEPADPLEAARAEALQVRPLAPEELKLGTEYRKLRAISAYAPVLHAGWVQPGLPEADAMPFDLKTLGVLNPRGTVRVDLSRFLHITLDLTYQAPSAGPTAGANDGLDEIALAPQYHLSATRIVRSGELHYFDHPAFGVLVRVTPVAAQNGAATRRPAA